MGETPLVSFFFKKQKLKDGISIKNSDHISDWTGSFPVPLKKSEY